MKSSPLKPLSRATFLSLLVASLPLQAAEFKYEVPGSGSGATKVQWDQDGVWTDRDGNPYGPGIHPGSGDSIIGLNGVANATVTEFFLSGDRTIARLEGGNLTLVRLFSGSIASSTGDNTLTITERFQANEKNRFYLRSQSNSKLTINTASLGMDGEGWVEIGTSSLSNGNISFTSQETSFTGGLARFTVNSHFDAANGYIGLGHVTFDTNTGFNSGITINANTSGTGTSKVHVASLNSTNNSTEGRIQGTGTVIIDSSTSSLPLPEVANFGRAISGAIRIEKKGDSLQIFSFEEPETTKTTANTYTGGTLIEGGTLAVRNSKGSGLGTGAVTVAANGTLAGDGRIALSTGNAITVNSGGRIAPGEDNKILVTAGHETFQFHTLTLHKTGLKMEEDSAFSFRVSADGSSDQIAFTDYAANSLTLDGDNIRIDISGELKTDKTYILFTFADASGGAKSSGLTSGLTTGDGFDGYIATFHYDDASYGGIGTISMTVAAIPEPSTGLLILPFFVGAYCYQQRYRKG